MTITRIPLSQPIETRDGTLTKDSKSVNGYFESRDQKREFIKRPGVAVSTQLPVGVGQGMYTFQSKLYAVVDNVLYRIEEDGTYTTISPPMTGDTNISYFSQSLPTLNSDSVSKGSVLLTKAGTYTFKIPLGVENITVSLSAAGGGGGGFFGSGDTHAGGAGGSGGFYTDEILVVTPGEILDIVIGAGGKSASFEFNGGFICTGTAYGTSGTYWDGMAGGDTYIKRGLTELLRATGGEQGYGAGPGDNMGNSHSGAGGLPSGVAGASPNPNRNNFYPTQGGVNGTGFGKGGNGNGTAPTTACPQVGGSGYISIKW